MAVRALLAACILLGACNPEEQSVNNDCSALHQTWPQSYVDLEDKVLHLVNVQRSLGGSCGGSELFAPKPPFAVDGRLVCAARGHAMDMVQNNYFSHDSQNGESPFQRMQDAGYTWSSAGENIAAGFTTAADVVNAWMSDEGHCANIMGDYLNLGVGYFPNDWVQDFATP